MNGARVLDPLLFVVLGPTGSGKSDLALNLAERLSAEIINCDSVQLYRYMDIGTARTPPEARRRIPHHLFEMLDPDQHFTAADYARAARDAIAGVSGRGRLPLLVGGTGFYLRALLYGLSEGPSRDPAIRERLQRRKPSSLHRLLRRLDPTAAARIHSNDANKLIRALEVCIVSRRPMTAVFETSPVQRLQGYKVCKIGLDPERAALAARINQRCVRMFENGLIEEVRGILARGFSPHARALQSIGYHNVLRYLRGELSESDALESTQIATRQYAKRQRTWFRREPDVFWIRTFGDTEEALANSLHYLSNFL